MDNFWKDKDRPRVAGDFSKREWLYIARDSLARCIVSFIASVVFIFFACIAMISLTGSQLEHEDGRARLIVGIILVAASNFFFFYSELLCRNYFKAQKMRRLTLMHPRVEFGSLRLSEELDKKLNSLFFIGGNALRALSLTIAAIAHFTANSHVFSGLDRTVILLMLAASLIAFVSSYPNFTYVRTKGAEWANETEDCA